MGGEVAATSHPPLYKQESSPFFGALKPCLSVSYPGHDGCLDVKAVDALQRIKRRVKSLLSLTIADYISNRPYMVFFRALENGATAS
jgi:hypothetical protein